MPEVSILMPAYNAEKWINDALLSIKSQSFQDYELLIFDDGSTDDTKKIITEAAKQEPRIRVFGSKKNQGVTHALKYLIGKADGVYIGQLDADDWLQGNAIELCLTVLKNYPGVGFTYTDCYDISEKSELLSYGWRSKLELGEKPYDNLLFTFCTFHFRMFTKEAYEKTAGYDVKLKMSPDYDISLKLSEVTKIVHIPIPLYYYRVHDKNLSKTHYTEQCETALKIMNNAIKRRLENDPRYKGKKFELSYGENGVAKYELVWQNNKVSNIRSSNQLTLQ